MSDTCEKCNKEKISPDLRCSCRLEWQIEKCFKLQEEIAQLKSELEKERAFVDLVGKMCAWSMNNHLFLKLKDAAIKRQKERITEN